MLADYSGRPHRPSAPRDRLVPKAEVVLRDARHGHPVISHRIARTEAQGLGNVSLSISITAEAYEAIKGTLPPGPRRRPPGATRAAASRSLPDGGRARPPPG